jgi:penicillin-binding protein 1A
MLKTVILSGTGTGANIGKPAAGKTGTTDDYKDAYFVGYTPDIVTGVWIGDDNNKKIGLTGGTVPAKIWKDIMTVATKDYGAKDFDYPQIDLDNYSMSFGNAKVIGDDENPANEEKEVEVPLVKEEESSTKVENTQPSTSTKNQAETQAEVPAQTQKPSTAPVPKTTNKLSAPIPMAVPESLR